MMRNTWLLLAALVVSRGAWAAEAPLHVLILSGENNHDWRETTPKLKSILTASGRFAVFGGQGTSWYVWDSQVAAPVYTNTATERFLSGVWTSADGNRIAYLAGGLYFADRTAGRTTLLGASRSAAHASPCFSADGRYLAYAATSANVAADTNGLSDVYLYDCQTGSNVLVSQAFDAPASANGDSDSPAISPDGRFVAYRSAASNLVPNDANGVPDIFLWDRITGVTMLMSVSRSMSAPRPRRIRRVRRRRGAPASGEGVVGATAELISCLRCAAVPPGLPCCPRPGLSPRPHPDCAPPLRQPAPHNRAPSRYTRRDALCR